MTEKRYSTIWRNKYINDADNMDGMIKVLTEAAQEFQEMLSAGVELERLSDDYYILYTYDPVVAERFDFDPDDDEEEEEESDTDLEDDLFPHEYGGGCEE